MQDNNRLETVKRFLQLEISREQELQDIVTLAAEICNTPIALITFMEDDMQWIRFKIGTDFTQNTRDNSFCKYLVGEEDLMIVKDTLKDARFVQHPLVVGETNIRFYAGAPLNTHDGQHLGTLCVFDHRPHRLTDKQQHMLSILSKQVVHLMELEMSVQLLKDHVAEIEQQKQVIESSQFKLRSFMDSSKACHILVDKNYQVIDYNKEAAIFLKAVYRHDVHPGLVVTDYITSAFMPIFKLVFPSVLQGNTKQIEYLVDFGDEGKVWWEITFSPAHDSRNNIIGVSINAININERKLYIEKITQQNRALASIAHIQSHELRKPVASILGLMNVLKTADCTQEDTIQCLRMLEESVMELDETIHTIVDQVSVIPGQEDHRVSSNKLTA